MIQTNGHANIIFPLSPVIHKQMSLYCSHGISEHKQNKLPPIETLPSIYIHPNLA